MTIKIGSREISKNNPYIIAEVGSNWASLEDCIESVIKAEFSGADCVKFQLFTHEALYGFPPKDNNRRFELRLSWLSKIKEQCDRSGIDFMCSAFSSELADEVDPLVGAHKVASSKIRNIPFLRYIDTFKKPVFLSTGAAAEDVIERAISCFKYSPVILNYCVAAYPANHVDLFGIDRLRERFDLPVGYSDHTMDSKYIPHAAIEKHGAVSIEKHFKAKTIEDSPDNDHSMSIAQFINMVSVIRGKSGKCITPTIEELPMIHLHTDRYIATHTIVAGKAFIPNINCGMYRVSKDNQFCDPIWYREDLHKYKAAKTLMPGDVITEEHLVRI